MKKLLLTISFFLILFIVNAQVQTSYTVSSIAQMKAYYGTASKIYVAEKNSDYVICSPCTPDEVNIYAGAGGRKWMKVSDSAKADGSGSGTILSVTGSPLGLVDNTDPANPIIQQDASKVNISDTVPMLSHYLLDIIAGTNVTIDKTNPKKPIVNSSGGSVSGLYEKQTATSGQTVFAFTLIPSDNTKVSFFLNGTFLSPSYYSVSGNTLTMALGLITDDVLEERGVQ